MVPFHLRSSLAWRHAQASPTAPSLLYKECSRCRIVAQWASRLLLRCSGSILCLILFVAIRVLRSLQLRTRRTTQSRNRNFATKSLSVAVSSLGLRSARLLVRWEKSLASAMALASPVASMGFRSSSVILRRKASRLRRDRARLCPQHSFLRRTSIFDKNVPSHRDEMDASRAGQTRLFGRRFHPPRDRVPSPRETQIASPFV